MRKLIKGIMEFRRNGREAVKDTFAQLALGQDPDALFIACSDSRVAVNVFASTDPGDLFVIRNVGNMVAPFNPAELDSSDKSEAAALEFALESLEVRHIIVCGHSDCGAIRALCQGREKIDQPHLRSWLSHGEESLRQVRNGNAKLNGLEEINAVSKRNVLEQIEHLKSYSTVRQWVEQGRLTLHGLWFDIHGADVYYARPAEGVFRLIEEVEGNRILNELKG